MRELKLDLPSVYPELEENHYYDYSILVDVVDTGNFVCESYGACITSKKGGERASVPRITVSPSRIDELMRLLVRNGVGPIHLQDVVDDWL
ncbi:MAG: DUF6514 family protein [Pseudoflavonifractor sp.]|nr:DUF6514 family protein [Pseudoflavonifractor sp.]